MAQNLICLSLFEFRYDKQCRNSNLFEICLLELLKQVEALLFVASIFSFLYKSEAARSLNDDKQRVEQNSGRE